MRVMHDIHHAHGKNRRRGAVAMAVNQARDQVPAFQIKNKALLIFLASPVP